MLFKWFTQPIKRSAYKRRRSLLEAEFHKNAHNRFQRVMIGLELLTEPLTYGTETYLPLSVSGHLELRCANVGVVYERLEFLLRDYTRVINSTAKNPEWSAWPSKLEPAQDVTNRKWLDEFFSTQRGDVVRDKLRDVFCLLDLFRESFLGDDPDQAVLANRSGHLLRDLERVVEHYLQ